MADDHKQNAKPHELRNLEVIIRAKVIPFPTSKARKFGDEAQPKEWGM